MSLSLSPRLSSRTGTEEVQERQVYIDYLRIVLVVFYLGHFSLEAGVISLADVVQE